MSQILEFDIEGGGSIFVEATDERAKGWAPASKGGARVLGKTAESFEKALSAIKPVADTLLRTLKNLAERPEEFEVEFGFKIDGTLGAVLASSTAGAHCHVKLVWKKSCGQ